MIGILFVDDDAELLAGLRRAMHAHRHRWASSFATSGAEALAVLESGTTDVIVSDMLMPGMDGATLLNLVRRRHPGVVRIVLSGQSHFGHPAVEVVEAHQFLTKPCSTESLVAAIERSLAIRARLQDRVLLDFVGGLDSLPSPSHMITELRAVLSEDEVDMDKVRRLVASDQASSAKVLQLVNSAFLGLSRTVSDIGEAVNYLGTQAIAELVMSTAVFRSVASMSRSLALEVERQQQISINRATRASELALLAGRPHKQCNSIWTGAFLADIGDLVLAAAKFEGGPEVDEVVLGASVGAHLMSLWGLPHHLVETAALSRDPIDSTSADGPAFTSFARRILAGRENEIGNVELAQFGLDRAALAALERPPEAVEEPVG